MSFNYHILRRHCVETGDHILRRRRKESQEIGSEIFQGQNPHQEALHNLHGYHSIMVLPFILHLGFMTFTAFFVMHVQVRHLSLSLLRVSERSSPADPEGF